jgi:hypothetical protein
MFDHSLYLNKINLLYILLWFDLSLKKFKIWLVILYIQINILNKNNNQTY